MASLDHCITEACEAAWDEEWIAGTKNRDNCSGFVKAVASKLGVPLPATANADRLVDELAGKWTRLDSGKDAAQKASTGVLVVAGLKSSAHTPARNNGHVVVVVGGSLYRNTYPMCWCGSIGSARSQGTKSVGEIWSRADRDRVQYYACTAGVICPPPR